MLVRIVHANIHFAAFSGGPHPETMQRIGVLCKVFIEVIELYKICEIFRGGPPPFGVIEIQTWSIVRRAHIFGENFDTQSPTPYNGKNFRSQIGPVESNKHRI